MKKSKFESKKFLKRITSFKNNSVLSKSQFETAKEIILNFDNLLHNYPDIENYNTIFLRFLEELEKNAILPYSFAPFHTQNKWFFQFGLDFLKPFVDLQHSTCFGLENIERINQQLKRGENIILFSNHQTEADPQMLFMIFEKLNKAQFCQQIIFVAGERVITDPFAIPFSLGCNLICIFSKKHIDNPPKRRKSKLAHNQKVMQEVSSLLKEGGQLIWLAPSGGRDRPDADGNYQVAPFDENAIEMFYLLSKKSQCKTHFYPLSILTYPILPPPKELGKELGEKRPFFKSSIHFYFGNEVPMDTFQDKDKKLLRKKRKDFIFKEVIQNYNQLRGA
jgi:glycerol-3-phosphate O-acyltransferase